MHDTSQFEQTFREHYTYLFNLSNKILDDKFAAEDIVQNVFLSVWNKRNEIKITSSVKSYLARAAINACYDYLKKTTRLVRLSEKENQNGDSTTDQYIAQTELQQKLNQAINRLPEKCRMIFSLSRFEGLSSTQIAQQMDLSKKTVDNQIGIALQKLRDELKHYITLKSIAIIIIVLLLLF